MKRNDHLGQMWEDLRVREARGEETDPRALHDEQLAELDRRARYHDDRICVEQPSPRERREHFDEAKARNTLRPRTGEVEVQPLEPPVWCECGARNTGYKHPGHRYGCRMYASRKEAA